MMEACQSLHKLPNEVWIKILAYLVPPRWEANNDLANVRLTCSLFRELGAIYMFRYITLYKDVARIGRAVNFLSNRTIAPHIRQIRLRTPSWSDFAMDNNDGGWNIDLDGNFHVDGFRIFTWVPSVRSYFSTLFKACASTLQTVEVEGITSSGDLFSGFADQLETDVCECVADVLNSVALPRFRKLRMELQNFGSASKIVNLYRSGHVSGQSSILKKNLDQLKHFELVNELISEDHNKEDAQELINIVCNIDLRSLWIVPSRELQVVAPLFEASFPLLSHKQFLINLDLENFQTTDKLSDILNTLPQLQQLKLYNFLLYKDIDRWESIFKACLRMERLEYVNIAYINYVEYRERYHGCSGYEFCLPFEGDRTAYLDLLKLTDKLKAEGKMRYLQLMGLCKESYNTEE